MQNSVFLTLILALEQVLPQLLERVMVSKPILL